MNITCGEAMARFLANEGVKKVFGIIDGTYFGFYSSLEKYGIELVSPRHEATAVHMAGAYARSTGKLGVCMASNGPGVANVISGIAVENVEGNRVLVLTSCRRHQIVKPDRGGTFQCFDQTAVIGPMSKYSETVPSPDRLIEILRQGMRRSFTGRPGVVHIDVPENFINNKFKFEESQFIQPENYRQTAPLYPNPVDVEKAARLLANAKRPVIHAGSGVVHSKAFEELEVLANTWQIPVTTSWGARGALCEKNELSVPLIYIDLNNEIRKEADLVLVLGSRVSETDWWGKMPNWGDSEQTWIQVDIDPDFIARNRPVELGIQSCVKTFTRNLVQTLKNDHPNIDLTERKKWFSDKADKMKKQRLKLDEKVDESSEVINSATVPTICKQEFNQDAHVIFDGGNTAVWGQFYYKCTTPGAGIGTPKMGMLGAGVGQALGAQAADPNRQVYALMGDGAMGMHMQEIETAVRHNLPIVFLVFCDNQWGMVKMNQQFALKPLKTMIKKSLNENETINADFKKTDWAQLADSMGAFGATANTADEFRKVLKEAISKRVCSVIQVNVDPVFHMWAPGLLAFKKMHEEPAGK